MHFFNLLFISEEPEDQYSVLNLFKKMKDSKISWQDDEFQLKIHFASSKEERETKYVVSQCIILCVSITNYRNGATIDKLAKEIRQNTLKTPFLLLGLNSEKRNKNQSDSIDDVS